MNHNNKYNYISYQIEVCDNPASNLMIVKLCFKAFVFSTYFLFFIVYTLESLLSTVNHNATVLWSYFRRLYGLYVNGSSDIMNMKTLY